MTGVDDLQGGEWSHGTTGDHRLPRRSGPARPPLGTASRGVARGRPGRAPPGHLAARDRKSTRLNSSHVSSSYAVFCLKTKIHEEETDRSAYATAQKQRR